MSKLALKTRLAVLANSCEKSRKEEKDKLGTIRKVGDTKYYITPEELESLGCKQEGDIKIGR